jgi:hypothetical protein
MEYKVGPPEKSFRRIHARPKENNLLFDASLLLDTKLFVSHVCDKAERKVLWLDGRVLLHEVKRHVLHEPLERLAVKALAEGQLTGYVA